MATHLRAAPPSARCGCARSHCSCAASAASRLFVGRRGHAHRAKKRADRVVGYVVKRAPDVVVRAARCRALARDATARSRSGLEHQDDAVRRHFASRKRHRERGVVREQRLARGTRRSPCTVSVGEARQQHETAAIAKRPSHAHDALARGPRTFRRVRSRRATARRDRAGSRDSRDRTPADADSGRAFALGPVELADLKRRLVVRIRDRRAVGRIAELLEAREFRAPTPSLLPRPAPARSRRRTGTVPTLRIPRP